MNKKQLIAAWLMGVIIYIIVMVVPKIYYGGSSYLRSYSSDLAPLTNWSIVISYSLIVLIISGLLIYSLGDEKIRKDR